MNKLKFSKYLFCGVSISILFFILLNRMNPDTILFNISIKCINRTTLTVEFQSKKDKTIKFIEKVVMPSQFIQLASFDLIDFDDSQFLRLSLGDSATTVFIDLFAFFARQFSQTKYIYHWSPGQSQSDIISSVHHCYIADQNKQTVQIETSIGKNMLELNISALKGKSDYIRSTGFVRLKTWLASISLSIFLMLIIVVAPASAKLKLSFKLSQLHPLTIFFLGIFFFTTINSIIGWLPNLKNSENRVLSSLPAFSLNSSYQYTDLISKYVDDHFPFRNYLFYLNSFIRLKCFNESALADKVIPGKNNFFFFNQYGTISDFRHLSSIDTSLDNQILSNLIHQQRWLEKRNCKFIILFAPNKARIYADKLPAKYTVRQGQGYNTFDYYKSLIIKNGGLTLIDPTDSLIVARKINEVYYPGDTHWNYYGAFKAYQCILNELKTLFPALNPIREDELKPTDSYSHKVDLVGLLGLSSDYPQVELRLQFNDSASAINYNTQPYTQCIFRHNKTLNNSHLKVVVFGDSFTYFLMPFLNKHFEQSIYLRHYKVVPSLIEQEKPDVVIFESLERFLNFSLMTPIAGQIDQ